MLSAVAYASGVAYGEPPELYALNSLPYAACYAWVSAVGYARGVAYGEHQKLKKPASPLKFIKRKIKDICGRQENTEGWGNGTLIILVPYHRSRQDILLVSCIQLHAGTFFHGRWIPMRYIYMGEARFCQHHLIIFQLHPS